MNKKDLQVMRSWSDGATVQNDKVLALSFTPSKLKKMIEASQKVAVKAERKRVREAIAALPVVHVPYRDGEETKHDAMVNLDKILAAIDTETDENKKKGTK